MSYYYQPPDRPLNEEFVQFELDRMADMKERDIAEMIVEMRLQLALRKNNAEWLDALAMLLREEPIAFHEDEDGYEDQDNPLHESELHERFEKEEERLIKRYHEC
jgi:hypothetical protein